MNSRYTVKRRRAGWVIVHARTGIVRKIMWIGAFKHKVDALIVARWL